MSDQRPDSVSPAVHGSLRLLHLLVHAGIQTTERRAELSARRFNTTSTAPHLPKPSQTGELMRTLCSQWNFLVGGLMLQSVAMATVPGRSDALDQSQEQKIKAWLNKASGWSIFSGVAVEQCRGGALRWRGSGTPLHPDCRLLPLPQLRV